MFRENSMKPILDHFTHHAIELAFEFLFDDTREDIVNPSLSAVKLQID